MIVVHQAGPHRADGTQQCTRCGRELSMMGGSRFSEGAYIEREEGALSGVTARTLLVGFGETPPMLCEPFPFDDS